MASSGVFLVYALWARRESYFTGSLNCQDIKEKVALELY